MKYRKLGRTDLTVSEIGIGSGGFEKKIDAKLTNDIIDCALSAGANIIDIYNAHPEVRSNIGNALKKYDRNKYILQGHFGNIFDSTGQYRRTRLVDEAMFSYEDFLKRMHVDYVDIEMLHNCDEERDLKDIFEGGLLDKAKELKRNRNIGYIGISTHSAKIARLAAEQGDIDVILFSMNPAYDMMAPDADVFSVGQNKNSSYTGINPDRADLYKLCESRGVAITVMKGYAAGLLLSENESPFGRAMNTAQCIKYCLDRPSVASVMVGAVSVEEMQKALDYCNASEDDCDYSTFLSTVPGSSFSGHCMYCGHCAPCTSVIDVAAVNKCLDLAKIQNTVPSTVKEHYAQLEKHASDCVECGICMDNCPFGVDIISKMQEAVKVFGF